MSRSVSTPAILLLVASGQQGVRSRVCVVESFWESFRIDPRVPENAGLRASDADREVVRSLLSEAYADGRLTREEHDERVAAVLGAVTLGELPPLVADLLPSTSLAPRPRGALSPAEIQARAVAKYRTDLREAFGVFLLPNLICWTIWIVTGMHGTPPWPIWVLFSGIPFAMLALNRGPEIRKNVERLERKERKRLEGDQGLPGLPGPPGLPRPPDPEDHL